MPHLLVARAFKFPGDSALGFKSLDLIQSAAYSGELKMMLSLF